jgi:hypothetical protein
MTQEALKLALEALETPWNAPYVDGCDLALGKRVKAIIAIKEALAQTQDGQCKYCTDGCPACDARKLPPQRTWVGLTDEEIDKLRSGYQSGRIGSFVALAQAIEAKLKELNT